MKKSIGIIYTAVFIALCCIPLGATLLFPAPETIGKEETQQMPALITDEGKINKNIGTEFDKFFTSSIPFRPQVITAQNMLSGAVLGKKNNNVITGSSGWLFTGESMDEYIGVMYSDRALHNVSETIRIMQKCVTEKGMNFVFTVAPDKAQIYPEYLPAGYKKSDKNNLTVLEKYLKDDKINYVSLRDEMLGKKQDGAFLYLTGDTHWNGLGALYGYNAIINSLPGRHETFSGVGCTVRSDWQGDIAKIVYPAAVPECSQYYFDIDISDIRFMQPRSDKPNDELMAELQSNLEKNDSIIRTMNAKGKGSVYVSRDSFCRAMLPFLVSNYRNAYITRSRSIDLRADTKYDDVVYEMVERKLDSITDTVPLLYAPAAEKHGGTELKNGGKNKIAAENDSGDLRIYGLLDSNAVKPSSKLIVKLSTETGESYYEAFPITDTERLKVAEKSDYGFTALIKGCGNEAGKIQASVIVSD